MIAVIVSGTVTHDGNDLFGSLGGYPFYASVSYPGYTASVAIDAFLDWRRWRLRLV